MTRIKRGVMANKRRKNLIKRAKGFLGDRSKKYLAAKEALLIAGVYAFRDRKTKKRNMRKLWQIRLNAAVRNHGMSYSQLINALNISKIGLDRKILSDLAINNPELFASIVEKAKVSIK